MYLLSFLSLYSQLCMKITEVLSQEDQDKLLAQIDREHQEGLSVAHLHSRGIQPSVVPRLYLPRTF